MERLEGLMMISLLFGVVYIIEAWYKAEDPRKDIPLMH